MFMCVVLQHTEILNLVALEQKVQAGFHPGWTRGFDPPPPIEQVKGYVSLDMFRKYHTNGKDVGIPTCQGCVKFNFFF